MIPDYTPEYASDLLLGLYDEDNNEPLTEVQICLLWKIPHTTYVEWKKEHSDFAYADEIQDLRRAAWWEKSISRAATQRVPGKAALLELASKNIKKIGWKDTAEQAASAQTNVGAIHITILPTHNEQKQIEDSTIIDA